MELTDCRMTVIIKFTSIYASFKEVNAVQSPKLRLGGRFAYKYLETKWKEGVVA
jgi:hypothetical protein